MTVSISKSQGDAEGDAVSVRRGLSTGLTVSEIRNSSKRPPMTPWSRQATKKSPSFHSAQAITPPSGLFFRVSWTGLNRNGWPFPFPSLRIESIVGRLAEEVRRVRKTGFTIAPEAGTERLRKVINKELDEEVLFQGLSELFSKGWRNIKLYFMTGLPTEREEDLKGIIDLSRQIASVGEKQRVYPSVNVSVSTFVPKPHTPFQWECQVPFEEMQERLHFLKGEVKRNRLHFKWQDPHLSLLEGIFSKGDRRLSRVLIEAHRLGCRFDGWSDQFRFPLWKEAFERAGVEMDLNLQRKRFEDPLPWSFIETGVKPAYLWEEYQKALREEVSPPCPVDDCRRCGSATARRFGSSQIMSKKSGPTDGSLIERRSEKRDEAEDSVGVYQERGDAIRGSSGACPSLPSSLKKGRSSPLLLRGFSSHAQDHLCQGPSCWSGELKRDRPS